MSVSSGRPGGRVGHNRGKRRRRRRKPVRSDGGRARQALRSAPPTRHARSRSPRLAEHAPEVRRAGRRHRRRRRAPALLAAPAGPDCIHSGKPRGPKLSISNAAYPQSRKALRPLAIVRLDPVAAMQHDDSPHRSGPPEDIVFEASAPLSGAPTLAGSKTCAAAPLAAQHSTVERMRPEHSFIENHVVRDLLLLLDGEFRVVRVPVAEPSRS